MIRVIGGLVIALALMVGIVPRITDCSSRGRFLLLSSGAAVPMECHWTAVSEGAVAVPLLALGVFLAASRKRETRRALAVIGAILGVAVALLPTALIGVCADTDMACNSVMKPVLILSGILTAAACLVAPFLSETPDEAAG